MSVWTNVECIFKVGGGFSSRKCIKDYFKGKAILTNIVYTKPPNEKCYFEFCGEGIGAAKTIEDFCTTFKDNLLELYATIMFK